MKSILFSISIVLFSLSLSSQAIYGGYDINISDAPWTVQLEKLDGSHLCGGAILDEYWILSAAHCINRDPGIYYSCSHIHAGSTNQSDNSVGQRIKIEYMITHPNWDSGQMTNDLVLIKLVSPLTFNNNVQPIELANDPNDILPGAETFSSGWGITFPGSNFSETLMGVEMPIIDNATSYEMVTGQTGSYNSSIVSIYEEGKATVGGDSGGPVVINYDTNPKLIGIVSFGGDPVFDNPSMQASVVDMYDWITVTMGSELSDEPTVVTDVFEPLLNFTYGSDIIINNGGHLVVQSGVTLNFLPNASIIVEKGGKLTLGGTLTSCTGKWKGVRAENGVNILWPNINNSEIIINGGIIENAEKGIATKGTLFFTGSPEIQTNNQGSQKAQFINCDIGVEHLSYSSFFFNPSLDNSKYQNTDFINCGKGAVLKNVNGVEFSECSFQNMDMEGIDAINTHFSVNDGSTFSGCEYGIKLMHTIPWFGQTLIGNTNTKQNQFSNNTWDVYVSGYTSTQPLTISNNSFRSADQGSRMDGVNFYDIFSNDISSDNFVGMWYVDNGEDQNRVYGNTFERNTFGFVSTGINTDLQFHDNCFLAQSSIDVLNMGTLPDQDQGSGEAAANCFQSDVANNIFNFLGPGFDYYTPNEESDECYLPTVNQEIDIVITGEFVDENLNCGKYYIQGQDESDSILSDCFDHIINDTINYPEMDTLRQHLIRELSVVAQDTLTDTLALITYAQLEDCLMEVVKTQVDSLLTLSDTIRAIELLTSIRSVETTILAVSLAVQQNDCSLSSQLLAILNTNTEARTDLHSILDLQIGLYCDGRSELSESEASTLSAISLKRHPYAGFARALYYAMTGEMIILDIELPDIREVEERSSKSSSQKTKIFPNPATSSITLSDNIASYDNIIIYDMNGVLCKEIEITSQTIDISNLNSGVYIIKLFSEYSKSETFKLLVTD